MEWLISTLLFPRLNALLSGFLDSTIITATVTLTQCSQKNLYHEIPEYKNMHCGDQLEPLGVGQCQIVWIQLETMTVPTYKISLKENQEE
jgi:hypothetical protein